MSARRAWEHKEQEERKRSMGTEGAWEEERVCWGVGMGTGGTRLSHLFEN